jgi:hypothetical protein
MSTLYLENAFTTALSLTVTGPTDLGSDHWGSLNTSVAADSRVPVLWFSRYNGLKNGTSYLFTVTFQAGSAAVTLELKLTGTWWGSTVQSRLQVGGSASGWSDGWLWMSDAAGSSAALCWSRNHGEVFYDDAQLKVAPLREGVDTVTVWRTPTSVGPVKGDHVWLTTDTRYCDRVLGGENVYYCRSDRWDTKGKYVQPEGTSLLSVATNLWPLSRIASEEGRWLHIPVLGMYVPAQAYVTYAFNGVCHQIANRMLIPAGRTVEGAAGYSTSVLLFGMYGTNVPASALDAGAAAMLRTVAVSDLKEMLYRHGVIPPI